MDLNIDYIKITYALGTILASVIAAKIIHFLIERYLLKLAEKTHSKLDDKFVQIIKKPIYYLIILLGVYMAVGYVLVTPASDPIKNLVSVVGIVILGWFVGRLSDLLIKEFGGSITNLADTTGGGEALPFLSRVVKIVIYIVTFSMVLDKLGYSIAPVITSLGLVGFAVGFAAKDTISNVLAGFFILIDRPFKIGDRVRIGSTCGDVVDIGLRTTKIETLDHQIDLVPNSSIVSSSVTNYSLPDIKEKLILQFGVSYNSNVEKVKKVLCEVAKKTPHVLLDPPPETFFSEFGDSSLNIKLVAWIDDLRAESMVKDRFNSEVLKRFREEGIELPFPVRTVYLHKEE